MSQSHRNTFYGGMDQDTSKSKYSKTNYYNLVNGKVLTEEGLSSGNIENEDGNLLSFSFPDTYGFWKLRFNTPENPTAGTLDITINGTSYNTGSISSIEDLYSAINSIVSGLSSSDYKLIKRGQFVYLIPFSTAISSIAGTAGLSNITGSYEVEPQTGLKVIGWTTLRDDVVVFTTNNTSSTPNSAGQIWKFTVDPVTKVINNIGANSTLTLNDHLIYNNKLNFSTHWHIGTEAIGHYENSKTGRVYWTDEYNQLRTINVLDPDLMGISPGDISIVSSVDLSMPIVDRVTSGGSLPDGAVVQYTYRLFNAGGGETTFAPLCNPVPLGTFDPLSDAVGERPFEANGSTSSSGSKAVTYTISNIDPSYNYIDHVAIVTIGNTSTIYKFATDTVPSDGNLTVIHTSSGDNIPITAEELAFLTRTFKRCKTITIKDKRLIAANLDTLDTTVDGWDSRAYRFNSGRISLLNDKELSSVSLTAAGGVTPLWTNVPEEHDCINPYNKENHLTPSFSINTANQYKYQSDGVTLGGEGLNVSYKFTTQDISLKAAVSGASSTGYAFGGAYNTIHYNRFNNAPYNNSSYVQLNGENRVSPVEYQSFLSPIVTNTFTGYARGEVYRFGICFYDKSGNPYNVKWIGDIKIPEATEQVGSSYPYRITKADIADANLYDWNYPIQGQSIGIEFTLNLSGLLDSISGYEIVRVKREVADRSRLGTGIMTNFGLLNSTSHIGRRFLSKINGQYLAGGIPAAYSNSNFQDSDVIEVQGTTATGTSIINDAPIFSYTGGLSTMAVISPTTILRQDSKYSFKNGDTIRTLGFYKDLYEAGTLFQARNSDSNNGTTDTSVTGYNILGRAWETNSNCQEYKEIEKEQQIGMGDVLTSSDWNGPTALGTIFANCSPASRDALSLALTDNPSGVGGQKQVIDIPSRFDYYSPAGSINNLPTPSPNLLRVLPYAGAVNTKVDGSVPSYYWREISYDRTLANQYGGDTYEARSNNAYMSTGTFKQIKEWSSASQTLTAFGGDVYVSMFHYQFYEMNYASLNNGNFDVDDYKYHLGFAFPCETPINCDYLDTGHYADQTTTEWLRGIGNFDSVGEKTYTLGDHYRKENNTKQIYYPADFIENTVEEHPHRIWASESKIDGELLDSWRVWLPNNYTEVEGQYGQINKITTLQDRFFFYQDHAFGVASINDRSVINDENGVALSLGSGGILDDYGYISRNTGTKQKFSVVPTGEALHHFDTSLGKWFRYSGDTNPLSDVKGLHSKFRTIDGNLLKNDRILEGEGIHGYFDKVRNKVYMTFLSARSSNSTITLGGIASGSVDLAGNTSTIAQSTALSGTASDLDLTLGTPSTTDWTICFNENIQAFENSTEHIPALWLENSGRVFSIPQTSLNKGWLAYEGPKNSFFGLIYPTTVELIVTPNADITSIFDNIEYKGEVFINDIDQSNLTFETLQVLNDHQDSGLITLTPGNNIVRKLRTWRMNIPRDSNSLNSDARMRDYYIKVILTHTPNNNEKLVLHDVLTNFRIMPH